MAAGGYRAQVGPALIVALIVVLWGGCVLDWDGARPVLPGDAAVEAAVDRGADRADAASDLGGEQDLFAGDLPSFDLPPDGPLPDAPLPDAPLPDAAVDVVAPEGGLSCTYVYSGKPDKLASAQDVNNLIKQGYLVHSFVHATDDHAAWLVDYSSMTYLALGETSGAALKAAVNGKVLSTPAWYPMAFLASQDITVWMGKTDSSTKKYLYEVVQGTTPLKASTDVSALAQQGWAVHTRAHHAGKAYAVWLAAGNSHTLLEDDVLATLEQTVNSWTGGGTWTAKAFLASSGYAGWGKEPYQSLFHFFAANQAATLESWLQSATSSTHKWAAWMVHADSKHAAWLSNGEVVLTASDGPSLAALINQELAKVDTHTVERIFSAEHYAVWLRKNCP